MKHITKIKINIFTFTLLILCLSFAKNTSAQYTNCATFSNVEERCLGTAPNPPNGHPYCREERCCAACGTEGAAPGTMNCFVTASGGTGIIAFACSTPPTPTPTATPAPPPGGGGSSNANCGVGCIGNWNCGTIPAARAPICSTNGGGFCTDCTCDGNCDPAVNCTQTTWCAAGISCGPGERCQWNGSGGGYVRSPWDGSVGWSNNGGWNCIPESACTTCSISLIPDPISVTVGSNISVIASITSQQNGTVNQVTFSSNNTAVASVNPTSDSSSPFLTNATGVANGTTTITANGYMSGVLKCTDTAAITTTVNPWWQAIDGDVISNGSTTSNISSSCTLPGCTPYLIKDGTGGFPGIVSYVSSYDFQAGSGTGTASSKNWLVQTVSQQNQYTYSSFSGLIPTNTTINTISSGTTLGTTLSSGGTQSSDGYYWYKVTGDLTISSASTISGRKVILLVEGGNLTINGNLSVSTPGNDFLLVLVGKDSGGNKGNITVGSTVTQIDGLYLADGSLQTGSGNTAFRLRGSASAGTFSLQRDLGNSNSNTPSEVFEFSPAMLFAFPQSLLKSDINWQEIAP